ncbi:histidine phosphatase family protein [Candidatus Bipolaricaulota bacterium]|nr:histidine phosphatase family protein [Candidatus Bipolaricaulota bacterium]
MRLLLVRHGETEWNVERRFMGQADSSLTARGERQAAAVGERLSREQVDVVISSDLGRAEATASKICGRCGLAPVLDARLRERHAGVLQGLTTDQAQEQFPDVFTGFRRLGTSFRIPGGESVEEVESRIGSFLADMMGREDRETVIAVTHGAILMTILRMVLEIPHHATARVAFGNTCICELRSRDGAWELHRWNDTCHLQGSERNGECLESGAGLRSPGGGKHA